jgi:hypothetical protein
MPWSILNAQGWSILGAHQQPGLWKCLENGYDVGYAGLKWPFANKKV